MVENLIVVVKKRERAKLRAARANILPLSLVLHKNMSKSE